MKFEVYVCSGTQGIYLSIKLFDPVIIIMSYDFILNFFFCLKLIMLLYKNFKSKKYLFVVSFFNFVGGWSEIYL